MSGYVVTGGNDRLIAALTVSLRLAVHREPAPDPTAWVHIVPGTDGPTLAEAVDLADEHLPEGAGATFIAVVPVWGVLDPAPAEGAELEAAAARALARSRMARWAAGGRRFNIVTYGALRTADVPGLRAEGVLTDRTPMHRTAELAELADAIDFLCSSAASYVTGSELLVDGGWSAYSWFHPARDL